MEECLRQELNIIAPRIMAIENPLLVNIINLQESRIHKAKHFPNKDDSSTYDIVLSQQIYISRDDFKVIDNKNYYRLAASSSDKIVRLKYAGLVQYNGHTMNTDGIITSIDVKILPHDYVPTTRVKGIINWVSSVDCINTTIHNYDKLLTHTSFNANYFSKTSLLTNTSVKSLTVGSRIQFEKLGYYYLTNLEPITFNKIATQ